MNIADWLGSLGFGQYAPSFIENDIDADVLLVLSEADLKELGVSSLGHRKKLIAAIESMRTPENAAPKTPINQEIPTRIRHPQGDTQPANDSPVSTVKISDIEQRPEQVESPSSSVVKAVDQDNRPEPVAKPVQNREIEQAAVQTQEAQEPTFPKALRQRRKVAALFVDIAGYAGLKDNLDEEQLADLHQRYFDAVDASVEERHGVVHKHVGDAVIGLFGTPINRGNDIENAVRASFAIHDAVEVASEAVGVKFSAQIGISTVTIEVDGDEPATQKEYQAVNDAINLASRLDGMAGSRETVLSNDVYQAVSRLVQCETAGEIDVKSHKEPLRVWRVKSIVSDTERFRSTPMVGRDTEVSRFARMVENAKASKKGHAFLVIGDAGVGKTRLLEEFVERSQRAGLSHIGVRAFNSGMGIGQSLVGHFVCVLLRVSRDASPQEMEGAANKAISDGLVDESSRPFLYDLLGVAQTPNTRVILDLLDKDEFEYARCTLLAELFRAVRGDTPTCVTIEDIHDAKPLDLAILANLVKDLADQCVVFVATARKQTAPLNPEWIAALQANDSRTIRLEPLKPEDATVLTAAFGDPDSPRMLQCIGRGQGNPLFLEQLMLSSIVSGSGDIPSNIHGAVLARTDGLTEDDGDAILAASVIGQRFSLDSLRFVLGDEAFDPATLLEEQILAKDGKRLVFRQPMMHETLYSILERRTRQELHLRAAGFFADRDPLLHAHHLGCAADPHAPAAYVRAAEIEASHYRFESALRLARHGVQIVSAPKDRWMLTCLEAEVLRKLGLVAESVQTFRKAGALSADDSHKCKAAIGEAVGHRLLERYDEALEMLDTAEEAATRLSSNLDLAHIHRLRGNFCFPLGKIDKVEEQQKLAIKFGRASDAWEDLASAHSGLGDANYARAKMVSAFSHYWQSVEIARQHDFRNIEMANRSTAGHAQFYSDPLRDVVEQAMTVVTEAAHMGHHSAEIDAQLLICSSLFDLGQYELVLTHAERAFELIELIGALRYRAPVAAFMARALVELRREDEGRAMLGEAIKIARETGPGFQGGVVLGGIIMIAKKDRTRESAFSEATRILKKGAISHNYLRFYRDAIDAALTSGRNQDALRYAGHLERYTRHEALPWADFFVARGRALAAVREGNMSAKVKMDLRRLSAEAKRQGYIWARGEIKKALTASG